jgi:NADPH-dependent 2,4-dienoyl-CoA reductase/sulfur reductase-like enzyme
VPTFHTSLLRRSISPPLQSKAFEEMESGKPQKVVVVGAGPVGSLAALYAASRGDDVEIYELRGGK